MVSFTDAFNYVAYKNPVSQMTIAGAAQLARATVSINKMTQSLILYGLIEKNIYY